MTDIPSPDPVDDAIVRALRKLVEACSRDWPSSPVTRRQVIVAADEARQALDKHLSAQISASPAVGEREQFMAWQTRKGFSSDWGWDAWQSRAAIAAAQGERPHPYGRCTITGPAEDVAFIFRHLPDAGEQS